MQSGIDAASIARFHDRALRERDWPILSHIPVQPGAWEWIAANHRYNGLLWREEERARRLDVAPADVAAGRRLIDRYDERRCQAAMSLDRALLAMFAATARRPGARLVFDTPGAMIDRLSVLALRIHHLHAHAQRIDGDEEHAQACNGRLRRLRAQRGELMAGLDALLGEARRGSACFHVSRRSGMSDRQAPTAHTARAVREGMEREGAEAAETAGPGETGKKDVRKMDAGK